METKLSQSEVTFLGFPGSPVVRTPQLSLPRVWVQVLVWELPASWAAWPKKRKSNILIFFQLLPLNIPPFPKRERSLEAQPLKNVTLV